MSEKVILIFGTDEDFEVARVDFKNQMFETVLQYYPISKFKWVSSNGEYGEFSYGHKLIFEYIQ